jgi:hypothetical protein
VPTSVVHARDDELIPVQGVIDWARARGDRLLLLKDTHRLADHVDACARAFGECWSPCDAAVTCRCMLVAFCPEPPSADANAPLMPAVARRPSNPIRPTDRVPPWHQEVRMRAPSLTLERVTHRLPEGRWLFSDIDLHLDLRRTGLIGRNGVGKSVLARILAGDLAPRRVLPSTWPRASRAAAGELRRDGGRLAGIGATGGAGADRGRCLRCRRLCLPWRALGSARELARCLRERDLPDRAPEHPAALLSGGEAVRVALAGAWLSGADFRSSTSPATTSTLPAVPPCATGSGTGRAACC